jgi:hypothetical protein
MNKWEYGVSLHRTDGIADHLDQVRIELEVRNQKVTSPRSGHEDNVMKRAKMHYYGLAILTRATAF